MTNDASNIKCELTLEQTWKTGKKGMVIFADATKWRHINLKKYYSITTCTSC